MNVMIIAIGVVWCCARRRKRPAPRDEQAELRDVEDAIPPVIAPPDNFQMRPVVYVGQVPAPDQWGSTVYLPR
jgi:hypothetical protein